MSEKEIKQLSRKLMESADLAHLATVDGDGFPQVRAMANLRNAELYPSAAKVFADCGDDFLMYFATHKSSDKMKHIGINPSASVYFCDEKQPFCLLLMGKIEIASDAKLKKDLWHDQWTKHFPGGVDDPGYAVLRFIPSFAKGCYGHELFRFEISQK